MKVRTTALDCATQHLREALSHCRATGAHSLPSLVQLSAACHVSHVTMLAAVRRLESEGLLYTRRGSGMFAVDSSARESKTPVPLRRRWQHVASEIDRDIVGGRYPLGEALPRAKHLAATYGVSLPTLQRALRALATQSVVSVKKRAVVPVSRRALGSTPVVYFAVPGLPLQVVRPREHRHEANMSEFDWACARAGIVVQRVYGYFRVPDLMSLMPPLDELERGGVDRCLGIAVIPRGIDDRTVTELLAFGRKHHKPVALLAEATDQATRMASLAQPGFRVFRMGVGSECGQQIGRMLLELGHRHIAFVGLGANTSWCVERLDGLRAALRPLGTSASIREIVVGQMPRSVGTRVEDAVRPLNRRVRRWTGIAGHMQFDEMPRAVSDVLLAAASGRWLSQEVAPMMAALAGTPVTAVVGANDAIAMACLTALREGGHSVPRDYSVAGFDDVAEAAMNGLTSYSFDSHAAAQAMLNHLLRPRRSGAQQGARPVTIKGYISVRQSTGPARG